MAEAFLMEFVGAVKEFELLPTHMRTPEHPAQAHIAVRRRYAGRETSTAKVAAAYSGERTVLGRTLVPDEEVPESYYVEDDKLEAPALPSRVASEPRVNKKTGFEYLVLRSDGIPDA